MFPSAGSKVYDLLTGQWQLVGNISEFHMAELYRGNSQEQKLLRVSKRFLYEW
jgi:hypothetical protein